ncbi:fibronectin type III domain-containing protein [Streptomyces capitiformicae]|uniref:Cellulose 1,4-beta-cellobiosidase n=1 Tax=Streptomyces capitiformicae TaxID=2014920 RepID=A0A919DLM1_9ACTN|nr:PA14 domain-containing protein [Streptomyces capitiformicae]GHE60724.1 hypothetical protein GCM10017771_83920 [Streptomyces capitiformicae]
MIPARATTAAVAGAVVLSTIGGLLAVTATSASAAATCKSPVFKRQFYGNTSFSGTPKKTDCDTAVSEDWATIAPASGVPKDNFGVRWTLTRDFGSGGPFTFTAAAQDGIRVYVDGVRKIDLWKNVTATRKKTVDVSIPSGKHTLRVDFAHWTGSAHVEFGYSPRTSAAVDKVAPLAPTGTSATYDKATGRVRLAWAGNRELDLAGYRVYRRVKGDDGWKRLARVTAASYTDSPPATGETYVYEIRAYDKAGNESAGGADRPVTTVDRTAPSAPTGVTATDGQPGVTLSWNPVPGAAHYLLHRRWETDAMDEPVVQVAKVTSAAWLDTTAREHLLYSYWVTAVDAAGNKSAKSEPGLVDRSDHAPSAPPG